MTDDLFMRHHPFSKTSMFEKENVLFDLTPNRHVEKYLMLGLSLSGVQKFRRSYMPTFLLHGEVNLCTKSNFSFGVI